MDGSVAAQTYPRVLDREAFAIFRRRCLPDELPKSRSFDSAEVRSAPYEQGWLRVEASRPCDRKKSQERGTELLSQIEHGVHCK
jgi:hypothetical protein